MEHKPRSPGTGIFTRPVVFLMVTGGVWSTLINLILFLWALNSGRTLPESMTMVFVSLVLVQFLKAYNFRSDRNSLFQRPFEPMVEPGHRVGGAAAGYDHLLPPLTSAFGAYPLPIVDWLIVAVVSLTVLPVLELAKAIVRKGWLDAEGSSWAEARTRRQLGLIRPRGRCLGSFFGFQPSRAAACSKANLCRSCRRRS